MHMGRQQPLDHPNEPVALVGGDLTPGFTHAAMSSVAVALDSETTGLDPRVATLKLLQVRVPGVGTELVRIDSQHPSPNIIELLANPSVTKIFHHAVFDLSFMWARWHSPIRSTACTKVAAKLLWPNDRSKQSLKALCLDILGVELNKDEQMSDWSATTLRPEQITYATADVRYLEELLTKLDELLEEADLRDLAHQCWLHLPTRAQLNVRDLPDPFLY